MQAFYSQRPRYSYFDGCSSGGRAALHEAQRDPDDYDGIVAGSPTIDNTAENTFLHAWNVRVNSNPDGTSILTSDKIPALAQAVLKACADTSGMIRDPRTCQYHATALVCPGPDSPSCLTPPQARAANQLWRGPVDESGTLLSPGDLPYGSEPAWAGSAASLSTAMPSRLVYVLNGPNLNLLGKREPGIYGHETLADVEAACRRAATELRLELEFRQTNAEAELIGWIHEARDRASGIVINPAAFTHTSVAILDALSACEFPIIEVHISNVHKREPFRQHSYVSLVASGVIAGCGTQGYEFALRRLARLMDEAAG
jgi:3-dehydroquinate dehydratase II